MPFLPGFATRRPCFWDSRPAMRPWTRQLCSERSCAAAKGNWQREEAETHKGHIYSVQWLAMPSRKSCTAADQSQRITVQCPYQKRPHLSPCMCHDGLRAGCASPCLPISLGLCGRKRGQCSAPDLGRQCTHDRFQLVVGPERTEFVSLSLLHSALCKSPPARPACRRRLIGGVPAPAPTFEVQPRSSAGGPTYQRTSRAALFLPFSFVFLSSLSFLRSIC